MQKVVAKKNRIILQDKNKLSLTINTCDFNYST